MSHLVQLHVQIKTEVCEAVSLNTTAGKDWEEHAISQNCGTTRARLYSGTASKSNYIHIHILARQTDIFTRRLPCKANLGVLLTNACV